MESKNNENKDKENKVGKVLSREVRPEEKLFRNEGTKGYDFENQDPGFVREEPAYCLSEEEDANGKDSKHGLKVLTGGWEDEWPVGDKTTEDFWNTPEDQYVELIDGVLYDMADPTYIHEDLAGGIFNTFYNFIRANKGTCRTYMGHAAVRLDRDNKTMVVPDVFIICKKDDITRRYLDGAPDLVVEVVSPSNWRMDVFKKRAKYERAGVREYWIVFPDEKRLEVYDFEHGEVREYSFTDKVPVGIWDGKCMVDFAAILEDIQFLYDQDDAD